jgi:DNA-binding NarL/FixJ family response regulator
MTGLEVLAALRALSPNARVIVITGGNTADRNAAMDGGASALFFKPFDDELFLAAVCRALASSAWISRRAAKGRSP